MSRRLTAALSLAVLAIFVLAEGARAGGLYISEFGTPALGTASAGANAGTDSAASAIHNPAAMTRLDEHQLGVGTAMAFSVIEFDPDPSTPVAGSDGGNQGGFLPIASGQYAHKLSDRWRLGFSFLSISGAILDPSDGWVGRNQLTESKLLTISAVPTVAYRVTDWLSLGTGPILTYGKLDYELRVASPPGPASEPKVKIEDADDFEVAAHLSALIEFSPEFRIGLTYNSEIDLDLSGNVKIPPGFTPSINLGLPLAQSVRVGAYWDVTDSIALLTSGAWEDWSTAKSLPVSTGGGSSAIPLKFKDTWRVAIGLHYRLTDKWLLQTGFAYDSSALDDKDRTVAFPIDRQTRLGFGALYDWSEDTRIGLAFEWLNLGDGEVDNATTKGDYKRNDMFFFGFNVNFKKLPWSDRGTF